MNTNTDIVATFATSTTSVVVMVLLGLATGWMLHATITSARRRSGVEVIVYGVAVLVFGLFTAVLIGGVF